jgi:hypothetical protein
MIISIDAEKPFNKIQYPFIIQALMKLGIEGMYLNIIKTLYDNPIANIKLNGEILKPLHLKSETRVSTLSTLTLHTLEFLVRAVRQEE